MVIEVLSSEPSFEGVSLFCTRAFLPSFGLTQPSFASSTSARSALCRLFSNTSNRDQIVRCSRIDDSMRLERLDRARSQNASSTIVNIRILLIMQYP